MGSDLEGGLGRIILQIAYRKKEMLIFEKNQKNIEKTGKDFLLIRDFQWTFLGFIRHD